MNQNWDSIRIVLRLFRAPAIYWATEHPAGPFQSFNVIVWIVNEDSEDKMSTFDDSSGWVEPKARKHETSRQRKRCRWLPRIRPPRSGATGATNNSEKKRHETKGRGWKGSKRCRCEKIPANGDGGHGSNRSQTTATGRTQKMEGSTEFWLDLPQLRNFELREQGKEAEPKMLQMSQKAPLLATTAG